MMHRCGACGESHLDSAMSGSGFESTRSPGVLTG